MKALALAASKILSILGSRNFQLTLQHVLLGDADNTQIFLP